MAGLMSTDTRTYEPVPTTDSPTPTPTPPSPTPSSDTLLKHPIDLESSLTADADPDPPHPRRLHLLKALAITFLLLSLTFSFFSITAMMHDLTVLSMRRHGGHGHSWLGGWMRHGKGCRKGMKSEGSEGPVDEWPVPAVPAPQVEAQAPTSEPETIEQATVNAHILPPTPSHPDPTMLIDIDLTEQNPTPESRAAIAHWIRAAIEKAKGIFRRVVKAWEGRDGEGEEGVVVPVGVEGEGEGADKPHAHDMTGHHGHGHDMLNHMRNMLGNLVHQVEEQKGPVGSWMKEMLDRVKGEHKEKHD